MDIFYQVSILRIGNHHFIGTCVDISYLECSIFLRPTEFNQNRIFGTEQRD
ncbi:hypothetical protein D3C73_457160 [compost metagenome]